MKILFVGMGSIGRKHYSLIREMYPSYNCYAYKRSIQDHADENLNYLYSWEEVDSIEFDLALICNPTSKHLEVALECAKRGINLFIEKPLSDRMEGLSELSFLIDKHHLKTLIGYNLRFHPVVEKVKQFVEMSGEKVISFSAYVGSYLPDWRSGDYRAYYSGAKEQGGGVILDLSHEIDYCKWIFGKPKSVFSAYGKLSNLEIDAEDIAEIIFEYDDKVGSIHLDYCRVIPKREIEIITDSSVFHGDLLSGSWSVAGKNKQEDGQFSFNSKFTYQKQLVYLIDMLKGNVMSYCDLEDAIETMQLLVEIKGGAN